MSAFRSKDNSEYSKDLFGGIHPKNADILSKNDGSPLNSRFQSLKTLLNDTDRSSDDLNASNTPNRRTPTHKQSIEAPTDTQNVSLATINQNYLDQKQQQNQQPLWFNNPKRRTIPAQIIKRENTDSIDADSSFLTKSKTTKGSNSGFKTLSFGTRKNNELVHLNVFTDESPPLKSLSDLQKEDLGESSIDHSSKAFSDDLNAKNKHETKPQNITSSSINVEENKIQSPSNISSSAVLVFGYPESIANEVIKHFSKYGKILEDFESTRIEPLFNNKKIKNYPIYTGDRWVKITYDNKVSVIRALDQSGTIIHGSMIFVVPFSKKALESIGSVKLDDVDDEKLQSISGLKQDNILDYSQTKKIGLRVDDKIFIKSKDEKKNLYKHGIKDKSSEKSNSILSVINNWIFGWDDI